MHTMEVLISGTPTNVTKIGRSNIYFIKKVWKNDVKLKLNYGGSDIASNLVLLYITTQLEVAGADWPTGKPGDFPVGPHDC